MNLDLLKHEHHLPTASYLDIMITHQLLPRIIRPTRIKNKSATLIDHLFTRDNEKFSLSGILATEIAGAHGFTDHFPIFSVLKIKPRKIEKIKFITKTYFTEQGHEKRKNGLREENWNEVYSETDPNKIYDLLQDKYSKHYHDAKTTRTIKNNTNRVKREPWMTDDILADMKKRDRLAKRRDRRGEYRSLRNDLVGRVRKAEREDLNMKLQESWNDIKKQWQLLKKATNKMNNKTDLTTSFYHNGAWIEDGQTNAENMNSYLAQVGPTTNASVWGSKHTANHYLHKNSKPNLDAILFSNVTEQEVTDVCRKLTPKTSCDATGLAQNIVLNDIDIMAPLVVHLVNCSQSTGICPDNSKIARVIPVYKNKGNKNHYENYRPISLLPVHCDPRKKKV